MARRLKAHDPTKRERRKPEPVEVRNVAHPRVWQTAMRLSNGNVTLVKVVSYCRVEVLLPN